MQNEQAAARTRQSNRRSKQDLRLWLRMLVCTNLIERDVRERLRSDFGATLPRFDFLAVLYQTADSLTMGELSHRLMVSNGNITGLAERLESEGLISRTPWPRDRRTLHVALTDKGRQAFERMAVAHEQWVAEIFSGLSDGEVDDLWGLLGTLKHALEAAGQPQPDAAEPAGDEAHAAGMSGTLDRP